MQRIYEKRKLGTIKFSSNCLKIKKFVKKYIMQISVLANCERISKFGFYD